MSRRLAQACNSRTIIREPHQVVRALPFGPALEIVGTESNFIREPIMNAVAVTITLSAVPSEDGAAWEVLYDKRPLPSV